VDKITLWGDKLRFNADLMIKLFTPTIDSIITLMKNTLSNRSTNDLSTILMVGGFSECPLIQDAVQAAFPGKRIIIPEDAGMSVLKGAVFVAFFFPIHQNLLLCIMLSLIKRNIRLYAVAAFHHT
jgi:molecular chaperone DnaK (HSP70)